MWHDHDLGSYATIGLHYDGDDMGDEESEFMARAERALSRFDDAVDWEPIEAEEGEGEDEDDEADSDEDAATGDQPEPGDS